MRTLYTNGKIFTADPDRRWAQFMLVEDGLIRRIGTADELDAVLTGEAQSEGQGAPYHDKTVDLNGKCVLPGFVDAHMHPVMLADFSKKISCLPPRVNSLDELAAEISRVRASQEKGQWIEGWGYDEGKLAEHRSPTRYDLDRGCSDSPVCLVRTCAHIRCVNSKALELAGIDRNTPDPEGGEIERDEHGEPTGILRENARMLIEAVMPPKSQDKTVQEVCDLGRLLLSQGIVAVADMGNMGDGDVWEIYRQAVRQGFRQQVAIYHFSDYFQGDPDFVLTDEMLDRERQIHVAGMKLIGDGSVSGRTAWVEEPYLGTQDCGMPVCSDELLDWTIDVCKKYRCQLSAHAMGGRTIDRFMERLEREESWTEQRVPFARIEHITEPSAYAVAEAVKRKIAFVTQPIFLFSEIESYLANLGDARSKTVYPIRSLLESGVLLALSTDAPATAWAVPSDPFVNLKAAVTRRAYDGTDCGADQSIDLETAIALYTREAAKVCGFPHQGQLKPRYRADFIVLDRDIFSVSPDEIDHVRVETTYLRGEPVFTR